MAFGWGGSLCLRWTLKGSMVGAVQQVAAAGKAVSVTATPILDHSLQFLSMEGYFPDLSWDRCLFTVHMLAKMSLL